MSGKDIASQESYGNPYTAKIRICFGFFLVPWFLSRLVSFCRPSIMILVFAGLFHEVFKVVHVWLLVYLFPSPKGGYVWCAMFLFWNSGIDRFPDFLFCPRRVVTSSACIYVFLLIRIATLQRFDLYSHYSGGVNAVIFEAIVYSLCNFPQV